MYTSVNPSLLCKKWGLRGSILYRHVFLMEYNLQWSETKSTNVLSLGNKENIKERAPNTVEPLWLEQMARLPWLTRTRFLNPYEILPKAQENKYLGKFSYTIMKLYVVCTD